MHERAHQNDNGSARPLTSIVTICPTRGFSTCGKYVTVTLSPALIESRLQPWSRRIVGVQRVVMRPRLGAAVRGDVHLEEHVRKLKRELRRRARDRADGRVGPFDVAAVVRRDRANAERHKAATSAAAPRRQSSIASSFRSIALTSSTLRPRARRFQTLTWRQETGLPSRRMRVLLLTPPMTQLNTPYPATAYLTGFLRAHGGDSGSR